MTKDNEALAAGWRDEIRRLEERHDTYQVLIFCRLAEEVAGRELEEGMADSNMAVVREVLREEIKRLQAKLADGTPWERQVAEGK